MHRQLLLLALFAVPAICQSNAVHGLDIGMYDVTDLGYTGRRGAAYPNGEAGFALGHSWCNGGSVNLPWRSELNGVMVDQYPRIAFLLARESNGRMVQISGRSFAKHSPIAFNFQTGPCLPCNVGSGSFFFVGCSDTYGSGINQSQYALGPTEEIDPWLGTWDPQGSYFDRGDPAVTGPAAMDSVRSLTFSQTSAFDAVKNRITVRESELIAGATYYGQVQAVVQGEPVAARGNNLMSRQMSITGTGSSWTTSNVGNSLPGSVLAQWQGATFDLAGNGSDDGRFGVAVKVTGPVNGMWHYEYAIHNIDNNRGGASFRIPLAPGAVVQNAGFRDLDTDPLNDWTTSQTATELSFLATSANPLEWNTIYNCWFDCSIEPGAGSMTIDQARIGPGALSVPVPIPVPSGMSYATSQSIGTSCGQCTGTDYEYFASLGAFDLTGRSMTYTLDNGAYTVAETPVAFVPAAGTNLGLSLNTQAFVTLPFALPYPGGSTTNLAVSSTGYVSPGVPNPVQLSASVNAFVQGQARWAAAWTLLRPTAASNDNVFFDATPQRAILTWNNVPMIVGTGRCTVQMQFFPDGTVHVLWQQMPTATAPVLVGWTPGGGHLDPGSRDLSATLSSPRTLCAVPFDGISLALGAEPVLGTTPQWTVAGIPAGTGWGALLRSTQQAIPPIDLATFGMPGCSAHLLSPVTDLFLSPGATQAIPQTVPNDPALVGAELIGQAAIHAPTLTPLGLVVSNAVKLTAGL